MKLQINKKDNDTRVSIHSSGTLQFGKDCLEAFGIKRPKYFQILFDKKTNHLGFHLCTENHNGAVKVLARQGGHRLYINNILKNCSIPVGKNRIYLVKKKTVEDFSKNVLYIELNNPIVDKNVSTSMTKTIKTKKVINKKIKS